jgi:hypothetical protein
MVIDSSSITHFLELNLLDEQAIIFLAVERGN